MKFHKNLSSGGPSCSMRTDSQTERRIWRSYWSLFAILRMHL